MSIELPGPRSLVGGPFVGEDAHDVHIVVAAVPLVGIALGALVGEADLLVDVDGAGVELEDVQADPV